MLRLPKFDVVRPRTIAEAIGALHRHGEGAQVIAGGTDLVPNMKHELFTPDLLVALSDVAELVRVEIDEETDELVLGAMTKLDTIAHNPMVEERAPVLAQAASLVAGPQLRRMGTLGGNVMLDTRCQWYNQTYFWREALGFCLKKDGTVCHVVESGRKCVAAASNDTAPALMTLGAQLVFEGPDGRRSVPIDEFWKADGIFNKKLEHPAEILCEIRVPAVPERHFGAYGKLRDRGSIDFPLLGVAARLDFAADDTVAHADLVLVALAARPQRVAKAELLVGTAPGTPEFDAALEAVADAAYKKCRPLENIPGDADYRREMVPVYVRRTLRAALEDNGPVHHV